MITVTATIWLWSEGKGGWHFLTLPPEQAAEIRLESFGNRGGFGSVRVLARINEVEWRTSLFPDSRSDGYLLPLKAGVRSRAGIAAGDLVTIGLELV